MKTAQNLLVSLEIDQAWAIEYLEGLLKEQPDSNEI